MEFVSCSKAEQEQLWIEHEKLVHWIVWRVCKRYGSDYDELYSHALVLFSEAAHLYESRVGSFSNWLTFRTYKGLQEIVRTDARRLRITGPVKEANELIPNRRDWLGKLIGDLSEDSRIVLEILFDLDTSKYKNKSLCKLELRRILRAQGVGNQKISDCFREIEAALT